MIQLKNSTWDHKKKIQSSIAKGEYSQTYCIAPGKSYVIEPQGGELNYDIAKKQPKKFYDQVLHQDMKKYSVKMRGKIKGELTQRPAFRIIMSIREALIRRIGDNIGEEFHADIANAFEASMIDDKLMDMVN